MKLIEQVTRIRGLMNLKEALDREAMIQRAVEHADEINVIFRQAFLNNPEGALKEIAEQLWDEGSLNPTVNTFGETICLIAIRLFPPPTGVS